MSTFEVVDKLTLTVLGAGPSATCGYPLAKDLFSKVGEFGSSLGDTGKILRNVIEHVVKKAEEFGCATPDDLAFQMHQRCGGDMPRYRDALRTLSYSRIATDAYFLSLEKAVTNAQLQAYKDYWHDALGRYSDDWFGQFPKTRHRLLSFNYDRMPELAIQRYFPRILGDQHVQALWGSKILNTGLASNAKYTVADSQFCYLKLHGSVGIETVGRNEVDYAFGHSTKHYFTLADGDHNVTDQLYFKDKSDEDGFPVPRRIPLLAFPVDKQRIESGGEDYNFKDYINTIRPVAETMFANAEEIRVVGYSFQAPDKDWLLQLIRLAPAGTRLIVHNPAALSICKRLNAYERLEALPLDTTW